MEEREMREENLISVVVCTYNQQDTIGRTLESILMQQCHLPIEIVVGEDCSSDQTLSVCQKYAKEHPDKLRILANNSNKGPVKNYFDCILAARGKYIADCAGDDFWTDPQKLEKEVTILESHPEVTLVHTDWRSFDENTGKTSPSPNRPFTSPFTDGQQMLEAIMTQTTVPVIHLCTSLYRRSVIVEALQADDYMFRNEFGCEDVQLSFVMAQQGVIAYLPDVTMNYSQGHESVSSSTNYEKVYRFTKQVTSLTYYIAQKYHITSPHVKTYFQQRSYAMLMCAFRLNNRSMLQETLQLMKAWNVESNVLLRLLSAIMKSNTLWAMALTLRNAIVILKKLFR